MQKINKKYEKLLFSFLVSTMMALIMSFIISWLNLGFVDNFITIWLNAGFKGFCVGVSVFLLLAPFIRKFVGLVTQ